MSAPAHAALLAAYPASSDPDFAFESRTAFINDVSINPLSDLGAAAGDLVVIFVQGINSNPPSAQSPSGWTRPVNFSLDVGTKADRISAFFKRLDGSEGATTFMGTSVTSVLEALVFSGGGSVVNTTAVTQAEGSATGADPLDSQIIPLAGKSAPCLALAFRLSHDSSGGINNPTITFSTGADASFSSSPSGSVKTACTYEIVNSSPADITVTANNEISLEVSMLCSFGLYSA